MFCGIANVRILQHHANTRAARLLQEVWIDDTDRRAVDFPRYGRRGDLNFLPNANPREIALIYVEDKPHLGKVRDLEQDITLLHVLAFVDIARHNRPADRRNDLKRIASLAW